MEAVVVDTRRATIYALVDPHQLEVVYVGRTIYPLRTRLKEHINEAINAGQRTPNLPKTAWMQGLLAEGLLPLVVELETVPTDIADRVETDYIMSYLEAGAPLLNSSGNPERRRYLRARQDKEQYALTGNVSHATYTTVHEAARTRRMTVTAFVTELIEDAARRMTQTECGLGE